MTPAMSTVVRLLPKLPARFGARPVPLTGTTLLGPLLLLGMGVG
ncbi:hypothetical protein [Streptomyces sp. NPDC048282]